MRDFDQTHRTVKRGIRIGFILMICMWLAIAGSIYVLVTNIDDIAAGVGGAIGSGVKAFQESAQ